MDKVINVRLEGHDALVLLMNVWLDGFKSGAHTAMDNYTDAEADESLAVANTLGDTFTADPALREELLQAIYSRLADPKAEGPSTVRTVAGWPNRGE